QAKFLRAKEFLDNQVDLCDDHVIIPYLEQLFNLRIVGYRSSMYRTVTVDESGEERTLPLFTSTRRVNVQRYRVEPTEIYYLSSQSMSLPLIGLYKIVTDENDPRLFLTFRARQATTGEISINERIGRGEK